MAENSCLDETVEMETILLDTLLTVHICMPTYIYVYEMENKNKHKPMETTKGPGPGT